MAFSGKRSDGFTLVELLVVVCFIAVLAGIAFFSFSDWVRKYNVEQQTLVLYSSLMKARADSIFKNRLHFVVLEEKGFSVVADTHPQPFGDGLRTFEDEVVLPYNELNMPVNKGSVISFDTRGYVPLNCIRTICIYSQSNPDTDCLVISRSRINIGKIIKQNEDCESSNCRQR